MLTLCMLERGDSKSVGVKKWGGCTTIKTAVLERAMMVLQLCTNNKEIELDVFEKIGYKVQHACIIHAGDWREGIRKSVGVEKRGGVPP